jgi:hypothetical protein
MNSRFKFRAWDKENKVLHYNAECAYDSMNGTPPLMHDSFGALLDDDNFIIEQCTGLTDKNGELVFEGDVIQENGINRYIHWHDSGWFYSVRYASKCHWYLRKEDVENAEIIGTIHDDQFRDLTNLMEE